MNARRLEVLPARGDAIMWAVLTGPVAAMFAVVPIWVLVSAARGELHPAAAAVIAAVVTPLATFVLVHFLISARTIRMSGPVITVGPDGFLDRRISSQTVPWERLRWYRHQSSVRVYNTPHVTGGVSSVDAIAYHVDGPYSATLAYRVLSLYLRTIRNPPWRVLPTGIAIRTDELARAMRAHSSPITPPRQR